MRRTAAERWLLANGAVLKEGTKHTKVYCNGKQTVLPRHNEILEGTIRAIAKQLGIKEPPSK